MSLINSENRNGESFSSCLIQYSVKYIKGCHLKIRLRLNYLLNIVQSTMSSIWFPLDIRAKMDLNTKNVGAIIFSKSFIHHFEFKKWPYFYHFVIIFVQMFVFITTVWCCMVVDFQKDISVLLDTNVHLTAI